MGREPTTLYVYDEAGRLVSSQPEVEWDDTERAWMQALQYYRDEMLCPKCGLEKTICRATSTGTNGAVEVGFERCHVTAAVMIQQQKNDDAKILYPDSLLYSAAIRTPDGA